MSFLDRKIEVPDAVTVSISDDSLRVELRDGRAITVPLLWYPRLENGSKAERNNWELIGRGEGINWPDLDEDISIASLIAGDASKESPASFGKWLESRNKKTVSR